MAAILKGNTSVQKHWESGRRSNAADRTLEIVETGPYDALAAKLPRKGQRYEGRKVESATLEPLRAGRGRLTVVCRLNKRRGQGDDDDGSLSDTVLEIEMAQESVDVRTLLKGQESYVCSLAAWEDAPARLKQDFKFENANGGEETLAGQALSVARLILSGIESVLRYHPVVSLTTYYDEEPKSKPVKGLGQVGGQPKDSPSGYEYLKTGDHWAEGRDGSWTRVEQWTGAKQWNGSLYRGGTGSPIDMSLLED